MKHSLQVHPKSFISKQSGLLKAVKFAPNPHHQNYISKIVFNNKGNRFFTLSGDGTIKIWEFPSCNYLQTIESINNEDSKLIISPEGNHCFTHEETKVFKWDVDTGILVNEFNLHPDASILSITLSHDGRIVYIAFRNKFLQKGDVICKWHSETNESNILTNNTFPPVLNLENIGQRIFIESLGTVILFDPDSLKEEVISLISTFKHHIIVNYKLSPSGKGIFIIANPEKQESGTHSIISYYDLEERSFHDTIVFPKTYYRISDVLCSQDETFLVIISSKDKFE